MHTTNTTIAFVTDDGTSISSHFGRALYYEILTLRDGNVTERKRIPKQGHHTFGTEEQAGHRQGGSGGHGEDSEPAGHHERDHAAHGHGHQDWKHAAMTAPLAGVTVLVARGMGMGAQQHLTASGIEPILTDCHTIDEAVQKYVAGTLTSDQRRVHHHGPGHNH